MKKVLVATSVATLLVAGISGASAAPVSTARASAFGLDVSGDLLDSLIEQEPSVVSELPPGGAEQDDLLDIDLEPIARDAVAFVQAETRAESSIVPVLRPDTGGDDGGGDVLGDVLGGGGGDDGGGGLIGDVLGGSGDDDNEEGEDIRFPSVNARGFAIVDLTAAVVEEGEGGGSGGGVVGDVTGGGDASGGGGGGVTDVTGDAAAPEGDGIAQIAQIGEEQLLDIVVDALLSIQVIQAEAVAVCTGNTVEFDTASRLIDDQGSDIEVGDVLDDIVSGLIDVISGDEEDEGLLRDLIEITEGSEPGGSGPTADGGVFVNGLRVRILPNDDGGDGGVLGDLVGDLTGGGGDDGGGSGLVGDLTGGGDDGGGEEDSDALVDITLAHAEVSGNAVCAQQVAPPVAPLPPSGDRGTLPVTGGGIGILPAVLGLGLAGGAVGAARLALRSRKESI